ncbi:hypothetical protein IJ425_08190 [bacterium]|nr:hypothetical protein [bacterium]
MNLSNLSYGLSKTNFGCSYCNSNISDRYSGRTNPDYYPINNLTYEDKFLSLNEDSFEYQTSEDEYVPTIVGSKVGSIREAYEFGKENNIPNGTFESGFDDDSELDLYF